METTIDTKCTIAQFDRQILSYKTLFFNTVITISCAFSPAMNKSLHVMLIKIPNMACLSHCCYHCWNTPLLPHCSHPLFSVYKRSASVSGHQWVQFFFCTEGFNNTPSLHLHFCVRRHFVRLPLYCHLSHRRKIWWNIGRKIHPLPSTPIPPTFTSDVVGQHNRIWDIAFGAALEYLSWTSSSCTSCWTRHPAWS